jgi:hypothetical protein
VVVIVAVMMRRRGRRRRGGMMQLDRLAVRRVQISLTPGFPSLADFGF